MRPSPLATCTRCVPEAKLARVSWRVLSPVRVRGIGGVTGKALAISLVAGAVYGVVKLVDLVTD